MSKKKKTSRARILKFDGQVYIHYEDLKSLVWKSAQNRKGKDRKAFESVAFMLLDTFLGGGDEVNLGFRPEYNGNSQE